MAKDRTPGGDRVLELEAIGRRVQALCDDRGWGAGTLAKHADLHWTYVREIVKGKRNIGVLTLLKLARAFDIDPCELLHDAPTSSGRLRPRPSR